MILDVKYICVLLCKYVIIPEIFRDEGILFNIDLDMDDLHYYRNLRKSEDKIQKIAYSTIEH